MKVLNGWYAISLINQLLLLSLITFFPLMGFSQEQIVYKGKVLSTDTKLPIRSVSITVNGTSTKATSDKNGEFSIKAPSGANELIFRHMGYELLKVSVSSNSKDLVVEMSKVNENIDEVVVTGIVERKKESFSGATASFSGEQIRTIGNQNVIQSLRSLDPSFVLMDNNLSGSNPNVLARIELRGKTSVVQENNLGAITDQLARDPNLPLFILDGFESSLRQITDLDINRIASITILKDAASTALYGARSANGVVVIETIKPKEGQLRLSYTGDFGFDLADLRDYNLMNAEEKLQYELLAGRYSSKSTSNPDFVMLERFYNQRLKTVREGVNTYWLVEPIRKVAVTQNHSLYMDGGSQSFQYNIGANLNNIQGVMKGSNRRIWGARVDLNYRANKFNFTNRAFVSGARGDESNYGSFYTYARINPYYKKEIVGRYVEQIPAGFNARSLQNVANPLYNSQLNSESYDNNIFIQNNLGFNYQVNNSIRLDGSFQLSKNMTTSVSFLSPLHTDFDNVALEEKGTYTNIRNDGFDYTGNLQLIYNKLIASKHSLTSNIRGEIQEINSSSLGFTAVGFPAGVEGIPSFAYSYRPDSKPLVSIPPKIRRINALASLNYVFDNRYFFDGTVRIDGSTAFGTSNKFSPFWSAGLGWAMKKESFLANEDWLDLLTLRGNFGRTGNQGFSSFASTTVYYLESNNNDFGQSLYHNSIGNPNLDWQTTLQTSIGLDLGLFKNRLTLNLNAYQKYTDPLIVTVDAPSSTGISNYSMNTGNLNYRGLEWNLSYSPLYRVAERKVWTLSVMGSTYKSRYDGFNSTLNELNAVMRRSASIQRFADGRSPDDIWAYKSLGIDPSNGEEIFMTENGMLTYDYELANIRVVANRRPLMEGVINSTLRLNQFTFGAFIRYSIGASRLNDALYNKVENINFADLAYNQDKRALEMRWKQPGDIAQFKKISDTDFTPLSSRFIQKENYFSGESISLGYLIDETNSPWLSAAKVKTLRFTGFMSNIFRTSNIVSERGIDYPFARRVSFSITASF